MKRILRCSWAHGSDLYEKYHDEEWGVPVYDDKKIFEMLTLEGAQAGLSWLTILKKRESYKKAFSKFDVEKISRYTQRDVKHLLKNAGIIRNRLKINSTIINARLFLTIQKEFGSFNAYMWQFVDYKTIQNKFNTLKEIPTYTKESDTMSKDLKKRGFKFVGSTICYAYMQATGMVNDHLVDCFRYKQLSG